MNNLDLRNQLKDFVLLSIKTSMTEHSEAVMLDGWFDVSIRGVEFDVNIFLNTNATNEFFNVYTAKAYLVATDTDFNNIGKVTDMSIELYLGNFISN